MPRFDERSGWERHRTASGVRWLRLSRLFFQILLAAVLAALAGTLWLQQREAAASSAWLGRLAQQRQLASKLRVVGLQAEDGKVGAFDRLRTERRRFAQGIAALRQAAAKPVLPAPLGASSADMQPLLQAWDRLTPYLDRTLGMQDPVLGLRDDLQLLESSAFDLLNSAQALARTAVADEWSGGNLHEALMQPVLIQRVLDNVQSILRGPGLAHIADRISADNELLLAFGRVNNGFLLGDPSLGLERLKDRHPQDLLERMGGLYRQSAETLRNLIHNSRELERGRAQAIANQGSSAGPLAALVSATADAWADARTRSARTAAYLTGAVAATAVAAVLLLMLVWYLGRRLRRAEEHTREGEWEQLALARLVGDLEALGSGDLSVRASADTSPIGAVGAAFNQAVAGLGDLVVDLERSSLELAAAARTTELGANRLAEARERQAQEIARAANTIHDSAANAAAVAASARETAHVARQARENAHRVGVSLRESVAGMADADGAVRAGMNALERLRAAIARIDETVALAQELGSHAGVLALNAAIQASAAGEAGSGFGAVAEDMQRLADRLAEGVQRTAEVARALQGETTDALRALERAADRAFAGAGSAHVAGEAARDIDPILDDLSRRLGALVHATEQQASRATAVARNVHAIQESGSGGEALATAGSAAALTKLTEAIRRTVARFHVPRLEPATIVSLRPGRAEAPRLVDGRRARGDVDEGGRAR